MGQAAVMSKRSGDTQDYRVLALSEGPLSQEDFMAAYREFSVGTMSFAASSTGEKAPWVTIGPFVRHQQRHIAVIRQDWTDRQDHYGRPVAAQYCVCLPESVLVQDAPSYLTLLTNIPNQEYFLTPGKEVLAPPLISLKSASDEVEEILRVINQVGFDFCSYVAAMLLVSPVAIVRSQELTMNNKLAFVDAVSSLLPYGSRFGMGVSTWMNSGNVEKIHLGFSTDALPRQKRIVWMKASPKELKSNEVAHHYYHHLNELWNDPEATKEQIISELANKRTPLTFTNSQPFLAAIREINREKSVYQAVAQNRGKKEEVRELLKTESRQKLSNKQMKEFLVFLLQKPELEDLEIVRENWVESLRVPACNSVKGLCSPVFQKEILWFMCQLAAEKGWLDKLLESLLESDEPDSLPPMLELAYQAIKQFEHDKERFRYLLFGNVQLAYEFLFVVGAYAEMREEVEEVLSWLSKDQGSHKIECPLLRIALGLLDKVADAKMIEKLAALDEANIEKLVRMAAARASQTNDYSSIARLAPAISGWLLQHLHSLKDGAIQWQEHLKLMQKWASPSPALGAQLDLIMLALDEGLYESPFVNHYLEASPTETDKYSEGFIRALSLIRDDAQEIIRRLITHLNGDWLKSPEALDNDIRLIGHLMPLVRSNHVKNLLISHIGNRVMERPSLVVHESFTRDIKEHLYKWDKDQPMLEILYSAFSGAILQDALVEDVVGIYLQMLGLASSPLEKRVAEVFSESTYFTDARKIENFLQALREALEEETKSPEEASIQTRTLERHLLQINSEPVGQYRKNRALTLIKAIEDTGETLALVVEVLDAEHLRTIKGLLDTMRGSIPGQGLLGKIRRK